MKSNKFIVIIIFVIYILFIYMDFFNLGTTIYLDIVKYIGILLCFIISLLTNSKDNLRDTRLLQIGMFFTTFADLSLVILENYILGVIAFTIVQLFYIARYTTDRFNLIFKKLLIIFGSIFGIYLIISKLIIKLDFILIPIGLFYVICLMVSVIRAIVISKDNTYLNPNKYMIAWGMILFLLGDLSIAVSFVFRTFNILILSNLFSNLIWIFYLPSQVLLSLSGYGEDYQ